MKQLILNILNSPYKEWIIFLLGIFITAICAIFKCIKKNVNKRRNQKNKRKLPWVGRIGGIDKNN